VAEPSGSQPRPAHALRRVSKTPPAATKSTRLVRAKDQTRHPCEFGANPFSGSCHPLSNTSPKNRTRFVDFAYLTHKWSPNHHRKLWSCWTKVHEILYHVDRTSALLTRPSAFPYSHPLWNASPKKESVLPISADFAPKIDCHGNVP